MIFEIHPPEAAGPLRIGAGGHDTFQTLKQLGVPLVLCPIPGSRAAWGVHRPSGLFIATFFDADNRLETIQFGRPNSNDDTVTYEGINVFGLPAGELLDVLRTRANIVETDEEDGSSFLAPDLHLTLWQPPDPAGPIGESADSAGAHIAIGTCPSDQHVPQTSRASRCGPLTQFGFGTRRYPLVCAVLTEPAADAADRPFINLPVMDAKRLPGCCCPQESDRLGGLQPGRLHGHQQCLDPVVRQIKGVARVIQTAYLEPSIGAGHLAGHDGGMPATMHFDVESGHAETAARPHWHKRHPCNGCALRRIHRDAQARQAQLIDVVDMLMRHQHRIGASQRLRLRPHTRIDHQRTPVLV